MVLGLGSRDQVLGLGPGVAVSVIGVMRLYDC